MLQLKIVFCCFRSISYSFDCPFGVATVKKLFPVVVFSVASGTALEQNPEPLSEIRCRRWLDTNLANVLDSKFPHHPKREAKNTKHNFVFTDRTDFIRCQCSFLFLSSLNCQTH